MAMPYLVSCIARRWVVSVLLSTSALPYILALLQQIPTFHPSDSSAQVIHLCARPGETNYMSKDFFYRKKTDANVRFCTFHLLSSFGQIKAIFAVYQGVQKAFQ